MVVARPVLQRQRSEILSFPHSKIISEPICFSLLLTTSSADRALLSDVHLIDYPLLLDVYLVTICQTTFSHYIIELTISGRAVVVILIRIITPTLYFIHTVDSLPASGLTPLSITQTVSFDLSRFLFLVFSLFVFCVV